MDSKSIVGDNVWVQVPPSAPRALVKASAFLFFKWDLNGWVAATEKTRAKSKAPPNAKEHLPPRQEIDVPPSAPRALVKAGALFVYDVT